MLIGHYNAARTDAVIIRQDWMGILKLTGTERQSWLQGMVTNEVAKLAPGQGCYAGHLNAQGKLVAQMIILVAEDEIWLQVERVATEKLAAVFDRLIIMEDVQVQDASDDYETLGVIGPQASRVLKTWTNHPPPDGGLYSHLALPQGRVVSADMGIDVIVPRPMSGDAMRDLTAAGAVVIARDVWNVLRTEAGLPLYGIDVDETTTFPELGQRGISYDKGCYIGQEVVARIKYIGHVNRRFTGFIGEGTVVPDVRSAVQHQGKDVGYVTTAVFSPELGKSIALGFVNRTAAEPGTLVTLVGKGGSTAARVVALPFVPSRSGD